jgi:hypothetical protein
MKDLIGKTVAVRQTLSKGSAGFSNGTLERVVVGEVTGVWFRDPRFFSIVTRDGKTIDYLSKDGILSVRP